MSLACAAVRPTPALTCCAMPELTNVKTGDITGVDLGSGKEKP